MRGGAALLEACVEIEAARENIRQSLSLHERAKARYIFGILDELDKISNSFVHSLFIAAAAFLILVVLDLAKRGIDFNFLFILLISAAVGIISHKTIKHFYCDRKCARLAKELAGKMAVDAKLKEVFWKINRDCHPADRRLISLVWKEGIAK